LSFIFNLMTRNLCASASHFILVMACSNCNLSSCFALHLRQSKTITKTSITWTRSDNQQGRQGLNHPEKRRAPEAATLVSGPSVSGWNQGAAEYAATLGRIQIQGTKTHFNRNRAANWIKYSVTNCSWSLMSFQLQIYNYDC